MKRNSVLVLLLVLFLLLGAGCASESEESGESGELSDNLEFSDGDVEQESVAELETTDEEIYEAEEELESVEEIDEEEVIGELEEETVEVENVPSEGEITEEYVIEEEETESELEAEVEPELVQICPPGERYCYTEKKAAICSDDGTHWIRQYCEGNAICLDGRCVPLLCEPGERRCMDQFVLACDDTGTELQLLEQCDERSFCENGECVDWCMQAEEVFDNTVIVGTTEGEENSFEASSRCWSPGGVEVSYPGPDKWYRIYLEEGQSITVKITSLTRHFDPAVYIVDNCTIASPQCLTGSDVCCGATPEILRFTAARTGYFWIVVDSWNGNTGEFQLKITGGSPADVNLKLSDLSYQFDEENRTLTLSVNVQNSGTETITRAEVGFFLNRAELPTDTDNPDRLLEITNLAAGEVRTLQVEFSNPAAGNYTSWVVADPRKRLAETNEQDNTAGPLGYALTGEFEEYTVEPPEIVDGRIQGEGVKVYYHFACTENQIVAVKLWVPEGSSLLPGFEVYAPDRETRLENVQPISVEELPVYKVVRCEETGNYLVVVEASASADDEQKIGNFELGVAPLQSFYAFPNNLKLFPGKSSTCKVMASWQGGLLEESELPAEYFRWVSFTPNVVSVDNSGVITAVGSAGEAFGRVAVISSGEGLQPSYVNVEVSRQIPGIIYNSMDHFPMQIPDEDSVLTRVYVQNSARLQQIFVGVSITHGDISQLRLMLRSPQGTSITLYNGGGHGRNILTIYGIIDDVSGPGSLGDFVGENPYGVWELTVQDTHSGTVGRINSWRLYIVHEEQ